MAMSMAPAATTTDPDPTGSKPNGHVTLRLLRPGPGPRRSGQGVNPRGSHPRRVAGISRAGTRGSAPDPG